MPRHKYKKSTNKIDAIYKSLEVAKLINYVMVDGKKTVAEKIVYGVLEKLQKEKQDPIAVLNQAIDNVAPVHEVKPRRLGGASYMVPIEVRKERRLFLAINWMINAAKARPNKEYHSFIDKLLAEIKEAAQNQGQAVAKKLSTEKLAESNRAFAHLRW